MIAGHMNLQVKTMDSFTDVPLQVKTMGSCIHVQVMAMESIM